MKQRVQIWGVTATLLFFAGLLGYYSAYFAWEELRPWHTYKVTFARTLGLNKDDNVLVYGLRVGRVHKIQLEGDHQVVELQVEPDVVFYKTGLRVEIRSVNAFGDVGVWVDQGDRESGPWDYDKPIAGTFQAGFEAPSDSSASSSLTEMLRGFESFSETLTSSDSGLVGRAINDPDGAITVRDGVSGLRGTIATVHDAVIDAATGGGLGAVADPDRGILLAESSRTLRETMFTTHEGARAARQGEGLVGRLVAEGDDGARMRETVRTAAADLEGYRAGEFQGPLGLVTRNDEAGERLAEGLATLADSSSDAVRGEGTLFLPGSLLGPDSGERTSETLAEHAQRLADLASADPSAGTLFSPAPEGKRAIDDFVQRIDDVLRDMRNALGRVRAGQAPNTFAGMLLSVF